MRKLQCVISPSAASDLRYGVSYMAERHVVQGVARPMASAAGSSGALPPIETVRTFFPETWIWDLVEVG